MTQHAFGLYLHIPFCRSICHYCDFSKTANYQEKHVESYFSALETQLRAILHRDSSMAGQKFSSVFFGGGTPGLFALEYQNLLNLLQPHLKEGAELSLEANPEDVDEQRLSLWRKMGINRISMGVQSFQEKGLAFLTRGHSQAQTIAAIHLVAKHFDNFNIDLIYGWQGQTELDWRRDLVQAKQLQIPHLSLYNLTYEPGTAIGRQHQRGKLSVPDDERLEALYHLAMSELGKPWVHDEVSNWSLPGYSCQHNWLYWQGEPYLALGSGAHGFLPEGDYGVRYHFPKDFRAFLRRANGDAKATESKGISAYLESCGAEVDLGRTGQDWLMELVGSGLRSRQGILVDEMAKLLKCKFAPSKILATGIEMGLVHLVNGRLTLKPEEWFRELSWSLEVIESFKL